MAFLGGVVEETGRWLQWASKTLPGLGGSDVEKVVVREIREMLPQAGRGYVRLAGVSGALAVALGAYGAHVFRESKASPELKLVFDTGNKYHIYHTLALLAVPLTNRPGLVGPLLLTGMLLFSGSCYTHALTGNAKFRQVTPYGGLLLIAGWVAMVL